MGRPLEKRAGVSFALCLLYLWFLPFTIAGMAALVGLGTFAMMRMDRRDEDRHNWNNDGRRHGGSRHNSTGCLVSTATAPGRHLCRGGDRSRMQMGGSLEPGAMMFHSPSERQAELG